MGLQGFLSDITARLRSKANKKQAPSTSCGIKQVLPEAFSAFGRIPAHTYELFTEQVRNLVEPVLSHLPLDTSREIRDWTVRVILEFVFRDWRENGNLEALATEDVSDLGSFTEFAMYVAVSDAVQQASNLSAEQTAVYKTVLTSLLTDWLDNWNANGVSGPPRNT